MLPAVQFVAHHNEIGRERTHYLLAEGRYGAVAVRAAPGGMRVEYQLSLDPLSPPRVTYTDENGERRLDPPHSMHVNPAGVEMIVVRRYSAYHPALSAGCVVPGQKVRLERVGERYDTLYLRRVERVTDRIDGNPDAGSIAAGRPSRTDEAAQ